MIEQSKDNPVFYVQYAHARCESARRKAVEELPGLDLADAVLATEDIALLTQASERSLMRLLAQYPRVVEQAAVAREPHRITFYLYDVAGELNGLWTKSKDSADLRFVNANSRNLTAARLALLTGVRNVLASGLALIGVSAPREMR